MSVTMLSNATARQTRPRLVLVATSLGVLFAQIDTSVVNLAIRSIDADLHAGISAMQWVVDAYNLVYASFLLTGGTLGDLYGRRRVFVTGIFLFIAGTARRSASPFSARCSPPMPGRKLRAARTSSPACARRSLAAAQPSSSARPWRSHSSARTRSSRSSHRGARGRPAESIRSACGRSA